jgi:hypothetical protein
MEQEMSTIVRKVTWGLAGAAVTTLARRTTRKALQAKDVDRRLPPGMRRRRGFGTAMLWAAGIGAVMAMSDTLREQRKEVVERS